MSNLLELCHFSIHRNAITLFDPLSLTIEAGQAYELRGKNGIGKTSLLETLAGLGRSFDGTFFLHKPLLYISQHPPFNPDDTLLKNLSFWAAFWGYSEFLEQVIVAWNLNSLSHLPYKHLSKGQQQRANLARLSFKKAPLWVLDEPTTALDEGSISIFKNALENHLRQGGGALIATHYSLDLNYQVTLKAPKQEKPSIILGSVA